MKKLTLLVLLLGLATYLPASQSMLIGTWESNKEKTAASVNAAKNLTETEKINWLLRSYRSYEYRKDSYSVVNLYGRSTLAHETFYPYKLLEETDQYYLIEFNNAIKNQKQTAKLYKEGSCFYTAENEYGIKSYFCKVK